MIAGALLFAITSVAYLLAPPFWSFLIVRLFQGMGYAFFLTSAYIGGQYQPGGPSGTKPQLFLYGLQPFWCLSSSTQNVRYQPLYFHPPLPCLLRSIVVHPMHFYQIEEETNGSVREFLYEGWFLTQPESSSTIHHQFPFLLHLGSFSHLFPSLCNHNHGVANPGFFFTILATTLILGRALGGKIVDLYSRERIILPCLTTYIILMVIVAFSKTLPMFILVAVIWGIGRAFLMPSLAAYALDRVGSSPAPVMGTFTALTDVGISLGPVIMGIIIHRASYPIMFLCMALTGLINLNYFYFFVRKKGDLFKPVKQI